MRAGILCFLSLMLSAGAALADEVMVAVATNFLSTAQTLQNAFEVESEYKVIIVSGSTGQLYAQILNGAPYEVFMSADQARPQLLAESGVGISSSVFTYARGRHVLWSRQSTFVSNIEIEALNNVVFRKISIANPDVAPYGAAARQVLERLGSWSPMQSRIVLGQNVAQAFAMAVTGNAELALIAHSQALAFDGEGAFQIVPDDLYEPIRQDAILLSRGSGNEAARDFLGFLRSPEAIALIERSGYGTE